MRRFIRPLLLTALVAGVIVNFSDIVRYVKIRTM